MEFLRVERLKSLVRFAREAGRTAESGCRRPPRLERDSVDVQGVSVVAIVGGALRATGPARTAKRPCPSCDPDLLCLGIRLNPAAAGDCASGQGRLQVQRPSRRTLVDGPPGVAADDRPGRLPSWGTALRSSELPTWTSPREAPVGALSVLTSTFAAIEKSLMSCVTFGPLDAAAVTHSDPTRTAKRAVANLMSRSLKRVDSLACATSVRQGVRNKSTNVREHIPAAMRSDPPKPSSQATSRHLRASPATPRPTPHSLST